MKAGETMNNEQLTTIKDINGNDIEVILPSDPQPEIIEEKLDFTFILKLCRKPILILESFFIGVICIAFCLGSFF